MKGMLGCGVSTGYGAVWNTAKTARIGAGFACTGYVVMRACLKSAHRNLGLCWIVSVERCNATLGYFWF